MSADIDYRFESIKKITFSILKWTDFNIVNVNIDQVVQKSTVNEYGKFLQNCPAWQYYSFFVW